MRFDGVMTESASTSAPQSGTARVRRRPHLRRLITGVALLVAGIVFITLLDSAFLGIGLIIVGVVLVGLSFAGSETGPGGGVRPSHAKSGYAGGYGHGAMYGGFGGAAGRDD